MFVWRSVGVLAFQMQQMQRDQAQEPNAKRLLPIFAFSTLKLSRVRGMRVRPSVTRLLTFVAYSTINSSRVHGMRVST